LANDLALADSDLALSVTSFFTTTHNTLADRVKSRELPDRDNTFDEPDLHI
jgi:hypothetical protein